MRGNRAFVLTVMMIAGACTETPQRISGPNSPTRDIVVCPRDGDIPDGCPLPHSDSDEQIPFTVGLGAATGTEPLWTGQDVDIYSESFIGECAPYVPKPLFTIFVPDYGEDVQFTSNQPLEKIQDLPPNVFFGVTVPRARYRVPAGPNYSVRPLGRYEANGGTVDATCLSGRFHTDEGVALILGKNFYSNFTGTLVRSTSPGGATGGSSDIDNAGWAHYEESDGAMTGYSTSGGDATPLDVILRYLESGECTRGWDLWVNGGQRCWA